MMDAAKVRRFLDYDPGTGTMVWLNVSPYHREKNGMLAGGVVPNQSGKFYHTISLNGRKYKRSRLAFAWMTGAWPTHQIDHINGDSTDDRWANLREATATQNAWNHRKRSKASHLPMGVRSNPSGRFSARIAVNKRMVQIGTFDTAAEASEAYAAARRQYYGQFA